MVKLPVKSIFQKTILLYIFMTAFTHSPTCYGQTESTMYFTLISKSKSELNAHSPNGVVRVYICRIIHYPDYAHLP